MKDYSYASHFHNVNTQIQDRFILVILFKVVCDYNIFYKILSYIVIYLLLGEDKHIETKTALSLCFCFFFLRYIFQSYRISYLSFILKPLFLHILEPFIPVC